MSQRRSVTVEAVEIPTDIEALPGRLFRPDGTGDAPGIVLLQEIFGLSEYVLDRASDLAAAGYAVLVPQLFARLDPPITAIDESIGMEAALPEAMERTGELDWGRAVADGVHTFHALRGTDGVRHDEVAVMGFCYGGGLAFTVAAQSARDGAAPAALIAFYGSALPDLLDLAAEVDIPSLHVFGTADTFIPMDQVERIREAVTADGIRDQVEFHLHEGAGHAFDNPHPMFHHEQASRDAWWQMLEFLTRRLPL
ncbi:dienelactone hydrolase family protein [Helcobacillus sp. ACRRO]|uniref:dienelactone hydrolase family protein n=1 Tax=Helcobacillus sp. ACRRO TaxID=2918202 RepID=UPI001EF5C841|nr:dienelactone hydrolase family protein [Helcobacillus sp. ACRRO]MCG7426125.1 dienelactone hydrolase family protein [Helcobacillus sp. ACRRO]